MAAKVWGFLRQTEFDHHRRRFIQSATGSFKQSKTKNCTLSYQKRRWNGRFGEISTYRYANHLPLRGDTESIEVNWCELTITREDTGEEIYKNVFCADFAMLETDR